MSHARRNFESRIDSFKSALSSEAIVDKAYTEVVHNASAKILRNGLAVIGFAIVEDFIKARTSEAMGKIGSGRSRFNELPEALQRASVIEIFESLKFQAKVNKMTPADTISAYQENATKVASTSNPTYSLPEKVFGFSKSNINDGTIEEILAAFLCSNGWDIMRAVGRSAGVGVLDLKSAFLTAAERRHYAAHNASASVEYSQLEAFHTQSIAICLCFDALISIATRHIMDRNSDVVITRRKPISSQSVSIRYIIPIDGKYKEFKDKEGRRPQRANNVSANLDDAIEKAYNKSRSDNEILLIKDESGLPLKWLTPYLD